MPLNENIAYDPCERDADFMIDCTMIDCTESVSNQGAITVHNLLETRTALSRAQDRYMQTLQYLYSLEYIRPDLPTYWYSNGINDPRKKKEPELKRRKEGYTYKELMLKLKENQNEVH